MSASAPWSVKGIDAKAREVAKDLARQSGMTLGEWLNQMILDGQDPSAAIASAQAAAPRHAPKRLAPQRSPQRPSLDAEYDDEDDYYEQAAPHSPAYPTSYDFAPPSRDRYAERFTRPAPYSAAARMAPPPVREPLSGRGELSRVAQVLDALSSRLENSESRSANAVRGVSSAVETLLNRLERTESSTTEAGALAQEVSRNVAHSLERLERAEEDQGTLAHRLHEAERLLDAQAERLEGLSGHLRDERDRVARLEAQLSNGQSLKAFEATLGKLANQLYEYDVRTQAALGDVRQDMTGLNNRLSQVEHQSPERVSQSVMDKVVAKMAERLELAESRTNAALKSLEQGLSALDGRISRADFGGGDVTDADSLLSMRRIGEELSRRFEQTRQELFDQIKSGSHATPDHLVRALEHRIEEAEKRSARAVEQMGQDVLRVAETLNNRLALVESGVSESQNRLSGEMRRVSDLVDGRLARAENSHTQALERLGGEIARISERLAQKTGDSDRRIADILDAAQKDFAQARERAATDLSDRIRQSEERTQKLLEETRARIERQLSKVQTETLLAEAATPAVSPKINHAVVDDPFVAPITNDDVDDESEDAFTRVTERYVAPTQTHKLKAEDDPFDADDNFTDSLDAPLKRQIPTAPSLSDDAEDDDDPFAEIDQSRKSAPSSGRPTAPAPVAASKSDPFVENSVDDLLDDEADEEIGGGVSMSTREALAAARAAVRASLAGVEANETSRPSLRKKPQDEAGKSQSGLRSMLFKASAVAVLIVGGASGSFVLYQHSESERQQQAAATERALVIREVPPKADMAGIVSDYEAAMNAIKARDPKGIEMLKVVAERGYAPAQYELGHIYGESKYHLVKADKAEARLWYQKAAEAGESKAMYNLGLLYYVGEGVAADRSTAAMWFRKAAERGVGDAQFNLGAMYQSGDGVAMNFGESYKWFTLAAKANVPEAAQIASEIKSKLTEAQAAKADSEVAHFVPISDGPSLSPKS